MVKITLKNGSSIYIDGYLINQLDSLIYNLKNDWDFVIIITGDRMVRTGKSVLAMNICAYLADRIGTEYNINNIFFESPDMIEIAQDMPKYSVVHYDEGREGLAANKSSLQLQKDLLDYFAECGQLNHIFVIVLPDFFELKENMAVARSECLINVYRRAVETKKDLYKSGENIPLVKFERGYFEFFNRAKKQELYDKAKSTRRKTYSLVQPNFRGRFTNNYPIDEALYREKKAEALKRFNEKKQKEAQDKANIFRDKMIYDLSLKGMSGSKISEFIEKEYSYSLSGSQINKIIKKYVEGLGYATH